MPPSDAHARMQRILNEIFPPKVSESQVTVHQRMLLGASIRQEFVERPGRDLASPMTRLMSSRKSSGGGRGGRLRLATELTLLWTLARSPHATTRPHVVWATLMGLEDPEGNGARSVKASLVELENRSLVKRDVRPWDGQSTVHLLKEDGSGEPYTIPNGHDEPYFRIPPTLWTTGLISRLSGPGLYMYVLAMELKRGRDIALYFPEERLNESYSLSSTTRKNGLKNLVDEGVLRPARASLDDFGGISHQRRARKIYVLDPTYDFPPHPQRQMGHSPSSLPQALAPGESWFKPISQT